MHSELCNLSHWDVRHSLTHKEEEEGGEGRGMEGKGREGGGVKVVVAAVGGEGVLSN